MKIEAHGKILLFTLWALIVSFFLANIARAGDPFLEIEKLYAASPGEYHWFGHAVAISGDIVVVCAPHGTSAYAFSKDLNDEWQEETLSIPQPIQFNCSVAASGDTVVVGNPALSSAYVFRQDLNAGEWLQEELPIPQAAGFGWSVAISGDTLVVGAPPQGSAHVFNRDGSTWTEAELPLSTTNAAIGSFFGSAVATDGDTVLVGAPSLSGSAFGSAHVFNRDGSTWTEVEPSLTTANAAAGSFFGGSVAIDGDTAVVGAPPFLYPFTVPNGFTPPGSAHVFMRNQDVSWEEKAALTLEANVFGASVAISGKTLVVGAPFDEYEGKIAGSVYVYGYSEGTWSDTDKQLIASDGKDGDRFGWSVAIDGNRVAAGALFGDAPGADDSGAAYLHILASQNQPPIAKAEALPDEVKEGEPFTLDGSGSEDPDGDPLIFNWVQISGPEVDLDLDLALAVASNDKTNPAVRKLVAPELSDGCDTLVFRLTVTEDVDGGLTSDPVTVKIEVLPNNTIHSKLERKHRHWLSWHKYSFEGVKDQVVTLDLQADPDGLSRGERATLILKDKIRGARLYKKDRSKLPNTVTATLPADGKYIVYVVKQPWFCRGKNFKGDYILTLEGTCGKLNSTFRFSKNKCKTR